MLLPMDTYRTYSWGVSYTRNIRLKATPRNRPSTSLRANQCSRLSINCCTCKSARDYSRLGRVESNSDGRISHPPSFTGRLNLIFLLSQVFGREIPVLRGAFFFGVFWAPLRRASGGTHGYGADRVQKWGRFNILFWLSLLFSFSRRDRQTSCAQQRTHTPTRGITKRSGTVWSLELGHQTPQP